MTRPGTTNTSLKSRNTALRPEPVEECSRGVGALRIGKLIVEPPFLMAPMAGFTNRAWRLIVRDLGGCGLYSAEMLSAMALFYHSEPTHEMMDWRDDDRPVSVQLFGAEPLSMVFAARVVRDAGADVIDINCGCPVRKVLQTGSGAALLKNLPLASRIIGAVVRDADVPITVKLRKGWSADDEAGFKLAKIAEEEGAAAVIVHGRTAAQRFTGRADWDFIRRVREAIRIPVIGNGDVKEASDALRMTSETGCHGVMIGRAALTNPWIFRQIADLTAGREPFRPSESDRRQLAIRFAAMMAEMKGEPFGVRAARAQLAYLSKGLPGAPRIRDALARADTVADVERILS